MDEVEVVALGPALALQLLRHVGDDVVLLGVHGHDAAAPGHLLEDGPEVAVGHPDGPERREDLEAGGAVLDGLADLADGLGRDLAGQDVVEGEVRVRVPAEDGAPPLDRLGDGHAGAPGSRVRARSPAKSTMVVTPPNAAARLAASGGWVITSGCPAHCSGTGMEMCACGSIPPGTTILPLASMTRPASAASVPGQPSATIVPPCTPMSSAHALRRHDLAARRRRDRAWCASSRHGAPGPRAARVARTPPSPQGDAPDPWSRNLPPARAPARRRPGPARIRDPGLGRGLSR